MENSNLETPEKKKKSAKSRPLSDRRKDLKKSRPKKEQAGQIKLIITTALACCLLIGCVVIVSDMMSKNDELEKTSSGDFKNEDDLINETEEMYKAVPYYIDENYERYMAFAELNPDKTAEDVIWMVNVNLDMPKYGNDIVIKDYDTDTLLVNKYFKVADDYVPSDLTVIDDQQLRQPAAAAFIKMRNDALANNMKLQVVSGYVSIEEQSALYNSYLETDTQENVDRYCARPGYSEHHTGLALDIAGSKPGTSQFTSTPEYPWVRANCYKYGFIIRYTDETEDVTGFTGEPWHLRYVGEEVSNDMHEKGITTYEEYYAKSLQ